MFIFDPKNNMAKDAGQEFTEEFRRRQEVAKDLFDDWEPLRAELGAHFIPEAGEFNVHQNHLQKGQNRKGRLYDPSGVYLAKEAATHLTDRVMPDRTDWIGFRLRPHIRKMLPRQELIEAERLLGMHSDEFKLFVDEKTNLRSAMYTVAQEWVVYDMCAVYGRVYVGDSSDTSKVIFQPMRSGTYYIEPGPAANRTGIFWHQEHFVQNFKRENPNIPLSFKEMGTREIPADEKMETITAVLPVGMGKKWKLVVYRVDTMEILWLEETHHSPIIFGKRLAAAGETYPTGWGAMALPDIQYLNTAKYTFLQNLAMWANPMWLVGPGMENINFLARPNARVKVNSSLQGGQSSEIAPLRPGGDPLVAQQAMHETREMMRSGVGVMKDLGEGVSGRTATEVIEAKEQSRRKTGPVVEDFKYNIVQNVADWLGDAAKNKHFKVIPEGIDISGLDYKLEVVGDSEEYHNSIRLLKQREFFETLRESQIPPQKLHQLIDYDRLCEDNAAHTKQLDIINDPEKRVMMAERQRQMMEQQMMLQQQAGKGQ